MSKNTPNPGIGSHNVIAVGTKVIGQILSDEDIRIDGVIEGNIECKGKIVVGPTSFVQGDINCRILEVMGKIVGNITCFDTMVLRKQSILEGDIRTKIIEIEPGAIFNGNSSMKKEGEPVKQ